MMKLWVSKFIWDIIYPLVEKLFTERTGDYSELIKDLSVRLEGIKTSNTTLIDYALSLRDREISNLREKILLLEKRLEEQPSVEKVEERFSAQVSTLQVDSEGVANHLDRLSQEIESHKGILQNEVSKFDALAQRITSLSEFDNDSVAECVKLLPILKNNIAVYKAHHREIIALVMDVIEEGMRFIPTINKTSLDHKISKVRGKIS